MSTKKESGSGSGILTTIIIAVVVVVIARACGSIAGESAAKKHYKERQEQKILRPENEIVEDSLQQFVKMANADLPKMADRITRFDSVAIENRDTIVEEYTIITMTKDEIDVPDLARNLRILDDSESNSSPNNKLMKEHNVKWICRYYDKDGQFILDYQKF
jgi:hypothetical protein